MKKAVVMLLIWTPFVKYIKTTDKNLCVAFIETVALFSGEHG